jgi:hypothetical protein
MNKLIKLLALTSLGCFVGWLAWLPIYLSHRTPDIEFDGPASLGMILSTALGAIIFSVFGIVLIARKKF